jgi:hypothetical protein
MAEKLLNENEGVNNVFDRAKQWKMVTYFKPLTLQALFQQCGAAKEAEFHGKDFTGNQVHLILKNIRPLLDEHFSDLPTQKAALVNYFAVVSEISAIATLTRQLVPFELQNLRDACLKLDQLVHDPAFKDLFPDSVANPTLKTHWIIVHLIDLAEKTLLTGAFSESGLESLHSNHKNQPFNPGQAEQDKMLRNAILTHPDTKQVNESLGPKPRNLKNGHYICKRCFLATGELVRKKDHNCPNKSSSHVQQQE